MNQTETCSRLAEAVGEALATMAFVSVEPADAPAAFPPDAVRVVIEFTGNFPGSLELMAPAALGAMLCANVLGIPTDEPEAAAGAGDALMELANVACGILLRGLENVELTLPQMRPVDIQTWHAFARDDHTETLDAEGYPLCLRLNGSPT